MNSRESILRSNFADQLFKAFFLFAIALPIAVPVALKAQTAGQGTISGSVTDSTGAVVPGAKVVATNTATNVTAERISSSAGLFTIAPLPPGTYSVSVEASGFRTLKQDSLAVNALGVLTFNPVLTIGQATETVEVSAAPPVLRLQKVPAGVPRSARLPPFFRPWGSRKNLPDRGKEATNKF